MINLFTYVQNITSGTKKLGSTLQARKALDSINSSRNENICRAYSNSASIIQGTGTGKSRTADEMAKEVFTIPLNVRNPAEDKNGR